MKLYRVADAASAARNLGKTALQVVVFWSVFLFALPAAIVLGERMLGVPAFPARRALGGVLFALGGSLGVWSAATIACRGQGTPLPLDAARQLVTSGPYRAVRNPMAVAGIAQGLAVGLFCGSWGVLLYALLGALLWHVLLRPSEERDLQARFGAAYSRYRSTVPLWLPWPRGTPDAKG